ncbi:MAG: hypothetical protein ACOYXR_10535 [Nitrospirota bacterium]
MELPVTWSRAARVWKSYFWRTLVALLASVILGAIVGGAIGFVMGVIGFSPESIRPVSVVIGIVIGIAVSIVPMKLILGKDFGEFRVVLLAKEPADNSLTSKSHSA